MKQKIRKLLFELTRNSRISTKNLSKILKASQQSCSYLIKSLRKRKILQQYSCIVDAVKLGFTNIIVSFNYLDFDSKVVKDILEHLKNDSLVTVVYECKQGVDLIVEFSALNLSAFNKNLSEIIDRFNKVLRVVSVSPVIVKHRFLRNYLVRKKDDKDIILCGDRDLVLLSDNEKAVLNGLIKEPSASLTMISKNTGISVKSVVSVKKGLEQKKVIKGYSCVFNAEKLGIYKYFLFLSFSNLGTKEMSRLVEFARQNKNIISLTKLIGEFQILLVVEELSKTGLIKEIRADFSVDKYLFVEHKSTLKKLYCPFVE